MMSLESELFKLAAAFKGRTDHIQGAGGNISVKNDSELCIKASGYDFSEIESRRGFVKLNFHDVAKYFLNTSEDRNTGESKSIQIINQSILNNNDLKPSMETGFHALLGKVVVHTHSVYTNLVNCMSFPEKIRKEIEVESEYRIIWLPYASPGFQLSKSIAESLKRSESADIYMLKNHGII